MVPPRREPGDYFALPVLPDDGWVNPTRVRLLNIERTFDSRIEWGSLEMPRLWTYHLHYFLDLPRAALSKDHRWLADVVPSWIESNPPGTRDAWDAYPISRRVVSWIKWFLLREEPHHGPVRPEDEEVLRSLAMQVRYLERTLEFDLLGNHLFANAVALVASGFFFASAEGDAWFRKGVRLLERELREQVLSDGGHFERSPLYHALVLEGILDLVNLGRTYPSVARSLWPAGLARLGEVAVAMLAWLASMIHPDGDFAFFNDTTLGVAPRYRDLADYALRVGVVAPNPSFERVHSLAATGYHRLSSQDCRTVVFFDAGGPGPDYQPGHSHCGALSIELSRDGERVFVNSGVSTYEVTAQRLAERSTRAHNTVMVDGVEQSEIWGGHRCGRRARVVSTRIGPDLVEAAHDGFSLLPGRPIHARRVIVRDGAVTIEDHLKGSGAHLVEWFVHLHPAVAAQVTSRGVELRRLGRRIAIVRPPDGLAVGLEHGAWHPGFNLSVPNRMLVWRWHGPIPKCFRTVVEWLHP